MGKKARERRDKWQRVQEAREIEGLVSRARFIDRIRRSTSFNPHAPVIDGTGIYLQCQNNGEIGSKSDAAFESWSVHNIMLPFQNFSLEFNSVWVPDSSTASCENLLVRITSGDTDTGVLALCEVWEEDSLNPADVFDLGFCQMAINDGKLQLMNNHNALDPSAEGYWLRINERFRCALYAAIKVLNFLSCRNIELIDHEPNSEDSAVYERHFGVPLTKYKTLAIKSTGKRSDRDGEQQQSDVMPLHLRRGNFAHYTDDAPLFGKFTGAFWRPATVVGSEKNGIVAKDYRIDMPEE